jgi:hypothetical protein
MSKHDFNIFHKSLSDLFSNNIINIKFMPTLPSQKIEFLSNLPFSQFRNYSENSIKLVKKYINFLNTNTRNLHALDPQKFHALLDIVASYVNRLPYSEKSLICPLALIYPNALVYDFQVTSCDKLYQGLQKYLQIFLEVRAQILQSNYNDYLQNHYKGTANIRQLELDDVVFVLNKTKIGQGSLLFGKIVKSTGSDFVIQDFHKNTFHVPKIRCHPYIPKNATFHVTPLTYK